MIISRWNCGSMIKINTSSVTTKRTVILAITVTPLKVELKVTDPFRILMCWSFSPPKGMTSLLFGARWHHEVHVQRVHLENFLINSQLSRIIIFTIHNQLQQSQKFEARGQYTAYSFRFKVFYHEISTTIIFPIRNQRHHQHKNEARGPDAPYSIRFGVFIPRYPR